MILQVILIKVKGGRKYMMKRYARKEQGNTYLSMGNRATFLLTGEDTLNRFALVEFLLVNGGDAPPHTHTNEDEHFYIVEGDIAVQVGDETIQGAEGTYVFLPRGIKHSYKVNSEHAKLLLRIEPAGFEQFFMAQGVPTDPSMIPEPPQGPPSAEQIENMIASAGKYGVSF